MEVDGENKPPDLYVNDHEKYVVHVKSEKAILGGIPKLKTAARIFQHMGKKCVNMNKISREVIKIECDNKETANALIKEQPFEGLKCFVPFHTKYCVGILRDMDTDLTEADIMTMFPGKFKSVYRMTRWDKETQQKCATRSVKITMECDELPEFIFAYGIRCRVHQFMQRLKMCFKCHSFGHFENQCRAEYKKCYVCGGQCEGECHGKRKCSSCNSEEHCFGNENCPVRGIEENIMRVMINNKLSYFEAKDWIKEKICPDAFSCVVKDADFPTIQEAEKTKYKKLSKTEINNNISLEITTMVNKIKKINEGRINKEFTAAKITARRNCTITEIQPAPAELQTENQPKNLTQTIMKKRIKFK